MRTKSKKAKHLAKKRKIEEVNARATVSDKIPDVFSPDFYLDDIDQHFYKKTKIDIEDRTKPQVVQEEVLPLPSSDEEEYLEEEEDQDSIKDDSQPDEEDEDNNQKYQELKKQNLELSSDEDEAPAAFTYWGPNKDAYVHTKQEGDICERIKKLPQEEREIFFKLDEAYDATFYEQPLSQVFQKKYIEILKKSEELPPPAPVSAPPPPPVEKMFTVEEVIDLLEDKLDFNHKNIQENLKIVLQNLPPGCNWKGWDLFPPLKKKMEDHKARHKAMKERRKNEAVLDLVPVEPTEVEMEEEEEKEEELEQAENETQGPSKLEPLPLPYEIAKNVGIKVYRKKEYRNPRVHNKNKYRKALIKMKSRVPKMRAVPAKYDGEKFGINPLLIRSRKIH